MDDELEFDFATLDQTVRVFTRCVTMTHGEGWRLLQPQAAYAAGLCLAVADREDSSPVLRGTMNELARSLLSLVARMEQPDRVKWCAHLRRALEEAQRWREEITSSREGRIHEPDEPGER